MRIELTHTSTMITETEEFPDVPGLTREKRKYLEDGNPTKVTTVEYKIASADTNVFEYGERINTIHPSPPFLCKTQSGQFYVCSPHGEFVLHSDYPFKDERVVKIPEDMSSLVDKMHKEVCGILDHLAANDGFCGTIEDATIVSTDKCIWKAGCTETWEYLRECGAVDVNGIFLAEYDKEKLRKIIVDRMADVETVLDDLQDLIQE